MKHIYKMLLILLLPLYTHADCGSTLHATPYFNLRSTSWNIVRDMVGWENLINLCDQDCWYGAAALTVEYDQTLRPQRIAQALFGSDARTTTCSTCSDKNAECAATIGVSSSGIIQVGLNRNPRDWLGDYLGVPHSFQSSLSFNPQIQNITADLSLYWGLDRCLDGLYVRINAPLTRTYWNLNAREKVVTIDRNTNNYPSGYFGTAVTLSMDMLPQALDFFQGKAPNLNSFVTDPELQTTFTPLRASLWAPCNAPCSKLTRLAALIGVVGWNFVCCDDYHLGLNIRAAAPTGNRPCGLLLFEPMVGNGHHWELGAGISAHTNIWECDNQEINLYLEGNITHLFKACQTRTFDLCNKPNSRYMLAEQLIPQTNGLGGTAQEGDTTSADVTPSEFQFGNVFAPVANLSRKEVNVSIAAQGDLALKLEFVTGCGFIWDVGYNLWGRTREKIQLKQCSSNTNIVPGQFWALKGDAAVYGFLDNAPDFTPVALAASENCADIHQGTNIRSGTIDNLNQHVDNREFAVQQDGITVNIVHIEGASPLQMQTSIQPILLTTDLLDLTGTDSLSNKLFTHLNYEWECFESCTPFLGAGASVEFGANDLCQGTVVNTCTQPCNTNNCSTSCSRHTVTVSQWGAWIKGGVAY